MDKKPAIKRLREKRNNKRWTDNEIKQLLEYLQQQEDFEKPTAQIFYRKFLKASKIDASWDLCRWKIKNLRTTYKKAETWRRSNGLLDSDPHVKDKLRKLCRFYDELHCVFAQRILNFPDETFESNTTSNTSISFNRTSMTESTMDNSIDEFYLTNVKSELNDVSEPALLIPLRSATTSPVSSIPTEPPGDDADFNHKKETVQQFAKQYKPDASKNDLDEISQLQSERSLLLKLRLEFEKERFRMEFELKERKFLEEIKERKENFELKKLEMQTNERLRILEMEKQERIERLEIEMRYRSDNH